MLLRMLYDDNLAQASYLVGCQATGEALVIDANREIDQYLNLAEREGLQITAVTETHIHADFVSGSRELAARTGARLYLSDEGDENWKYQFADDAGATLVHDGDVFWIGNVRLQVMHTPGHTPEHISFILTDTASADQPMGVFTGDFVFVGDVGRPDLLETAAGYEGTMEVGARTLFSSLTRFKELPDFLQIWPGHGSGSACGKALGAVPQSTLGYERLFNWGLTTNDEDTFVQMVLEGQPEPPLYFKEMKRINKEGPAFISELAQPVLLGVERLVKEIERDTPIVDLRPGVEFAGGHVPGTINIPYSNSFVTWAGWLLPYDRPFGIIVDDLHVTEVVNDLRTIGLDSVAGHWHPDVVAAWVNAGDGHELQTANLASLGEVEHLRVDDVEQFARGGEITLLDVRGASEFAAGHIPGAINIPVGYLPRDINDLPANKPVIVYCQSGMRASIASSVLQNLGRTNIATYMGSFDEWLAAGKPVSTCNPKPELIATR